MIEPIFRADLKDLSGEERKPYLEAIWRKCEHCNPYALQEDCTMCEGGGSYLRVQYSALVIDATGRLEENSTGTNLTNRKALRQMDKVEDKCGKQGCEEVSTGTVWGSLRYHTCDNHREEIEALVDRE